MAAAESGDVGADGGRHDHLNKHRPGAIVVTKPLLPPEALDSAEPLTAGVSAFGRSPVTGPRFSVSNKSGKAREIAKIESPGKIGDFYDFGSILGQGGFGTVTEILHAKTFQPFAGKVVEKDSLQHLGEDAEQSFRIVMETLLNLDNAHIVKMLHVFEDESNYYEVMEACQGGTLRKFVSARGMLPAHIMETILNQICCGIAFLHSLQMLHRDIKPDNVMLAGDRLTLDVQELLDGGSKLKMKIVDFDMCEFMDENCEVCSSHLEGTPGYLAPEVFCDKKYTQMTDLFAFGCIVYFMLKREEPACGAGFDSLPLEELADDVHRWVAEITDFCASVSGSSPFHSEPTSPGEASSDISPTSPLSPKTDEESREVPARLWRLMAWCVAQDPAQRPATAADILRSGLIQGEAPTPVSAGSTSPSTSKRKDGKKKTQRTSGSASIADILRLGADRPATAATRSADG